jgi:alkylation response protein AidB-like acyl-CoA dehydrogenase
MDFAFSEEQELLRTTAREFLARECPMTRVRERMQQGSAPDPGLWKKMAELGWVGLIIPEEYGGAGLGYVDLIPLVEELGRSLVPSPFLGHLLGALALTHAASPEQKRQWLPAIAAGERIASFAITEESGREEPAELQLRAEPAGSGYRLSGTKLFVPDAQDADELIVLARTGRESFGLFRVLRTAPGVTVTPLQSMDLTRRLAEVALDGAPGEAIGAVDRGWAHWEWLRDRAMIILAADACGGAAKALEDAVRYAKERVQFGKPIGVHQAIKHRCADMLIELESAKAITYYAAWTADQDSGELALMAAMAKARASDAYRQISSENIQIHGGVGFTWEYDCHLYFKRAKALEVTFGDATQHRERVAQLLHF